MSIQPLLLHRCTAAVPLLPQLSKEVRALRGFESALLEGYSAYLKALLQVRGVD